MGSRNLREGSWTIDLHSGVMFHVNKNFKWLQLLRLQIWLYRIFAEKPFMLSRFDSMRNKWFDALLSYGWRRCGNIRLCSAGQLPVCMQTEEFRYGYNSVSHIPILPAMRVLWYLSDASVWYIAFLHCNRLAYSKVFSFVCCSLWTCFRLSAVLFHVKQRMGLNMNSGNDREFWSELFSWIHCFITFVYQFEG